MKLTSTKKQSEYINCMIYGRTGMGKTPLCATAPKPLFIDTEKGTLSIADRNLPVYNVRSFKDLKKVYKILKKNKKHKDVETIILDSGHELAEIVLQGLKDDPEIKDNRQAYLQVADETMKWIRKFKDLDKHFIVTAKVSSKEVNGVEKYRVGFKGNVLPESLPYQFDELFCLRFEDDEEEEGKKVLQTSPCSDYDAKDRSNKLKKFEKPNMTKIFNKIKGVKKNGKR